MNDWDWTGFWRIVMDLGFAAVGGVSLFYLRLVKRGSGNTKKIADLRSDFREYVAKEHASKSDFVRLDERMEGLTRLLEQVRVPLDQIIQQALSARDEERR